MSVLSDRSIRRRLVNGTLGIDPWTPEQIQPASYDVRLGNVLMTYPKSAWSVDPRVPETSLMEKHFMPPCGLLIGEGRFCLGTTAERVRIPNDLVARIDGKSSLARLGLLVHLTAGNIDPGFEGEITLEFYNAAPVPVLLWPGMKIAHLQFTLLDLPCEKPYGHPDLGSKYQGQTGATGSKYWGNK